MIGRIRGKLVEKQAPSLVIDVNGVGYELEASLNSISQLPGLGEQVLLYTHLAVREDAHTLYGFVNKEERELFRLLLKVSGVGAKLALTLLSGMSVEQFCRYVADDDTAAFVRLPGVGKKTAQRLLIELRDRLPAWSKSTSPPAAGGGRAVRQEAVHAMVSLGYKQAEAERLIQGVYDDNLESEDLIRRALQSTMSVTEKAAES